MPGLICARAAAWPASPARIERRRTSISSASFDAAERADDGADVDDLEARFAPIAAPRPRPPGRSRARRRCASRHLRKAVEGRFDELAPAMRAPSGCRRTSRSDDLVDECSFEERPEHVVGDEGRPARLEQRAARLTRPSGTRTARGRNRRSRSGATGRRRSGRRSRSGGRARAALGAH